MLTFFYRILYALIIKDIVREEERAIVAKIIKLTPYYLLVNNTDFVLDLMEVSSLNEKTPFSFSLMPNTITPFWPKHYQVKQKNSLKFRPIKDSNANILFSAPVW